MRVAQPRHLAAGGTQVTATCLTNLKIWDGRTVQDADAIRMEGAHITAVGDAHELAEGARVISCAGATAIPGMMDAHVHLELNPDHTKPPTHTNAAVFEHMIERAEGMAKAGITTARDLGGGAWHEIRLRDEIAEGKYIGPRLLCSGQPITSPQGHCHFWGGEAANVAEAKAVLRRQLEHHVDLIKVMATGGRMTRGSDPMKPQFDVEALTQIVATAHSHNKPVAAHCHGTPGIEVAARAGVNTIEHCSWVGQEGWASDYQSDIAQIILEQHVWVSPTVNKGWQRMLDSQKGIVLGRVRAAYQQMLELGIPFVASTDAGIPGVFHADLPHALLVFMKIAELTNEQTLMSATSDAAVALGVDQLTGTLRAGMEADIVLLDGDPLEDLTAVTRPVGVWARGRAVTLPI